MPYEHIENLYQDQRILMFRECFAAEKLDGTHTTVAWRDGHVWLSSGGVSAVNFKAIFDEPAIVAAFTAIGHDYVTIHGEGYGGNCQKLAHRYGPKLRFVAFDVMLHGEKDRWLDMPDAAVIVEKLGLEFVHYKRVSTDLASLDAERDAPSVQARRNGVEGDQPREGVVLRPIVEMVDSYGTRVISKHKRDDARETATPRKVVDPSLQVVLTEANAIAVEWVTDTRLEHVLDKMPGATVKDTAKVITAMVEDVTREAKGEIVDSREARAAVGKRAAELFHARLKRALKD